MKKETVSSTKMNEADQFHSSFSNVIQEFSDHVAGKQVLTTEDISQEIEYFKKKADLKKEDDELSPEEKAYKVFYRSLCYEKELEDIDRETQIIHNSEELETRIKYLNLIQWKAYWLIIKDVVPKMHIDKVSLCTFIRRTKLAFLPFNLQEIINDLTPELDCAVSRHAWLISASKEEFNSIEIIYNNLTAKEFVTLLSATFLQLITNIYSQPIHDIHNEIMEYLKSNGFDLELMAPNDFIGFDNCIELMDNYLSDVISDFGKISQIEYHQKIKSQQLLLHFFYATREINIIRKKLEANQNDPGIWRNIGILQNHASKIMQDESMFIPVNMMADYYHKTKSSDARKKGWEPLAKIKLEAKKLAEEKWDKGDTATHVQMAKWVYGQLEKNAEYNEILKKHDETYDDIRNASYNIIFKAVKKVAPKDRIMGMRGVKKDKG